MPARKPYMVFGVIWLPFFGIGIVAFFLKGDTGALVVGGAPLFMLGATWLWIFHNRLIYSTKGVIHRRFWPFVRTLTFTQMQDFYTYIGFRDGHGRTGPFVRLVIEPKPGSGREAIVIPLKLFSPADNATIAHLLSEHLPRPKKTTR